MSETTYIHPYCTVQQPLEYEWDGCRSVTLFGAEESFADIESYVGSERLTALAAGGYRTVGAIFVHV